MTHMHLIADKTFNIIKEMNTKRKFANIYWTNICLSKRYDTISLLLNKLCEVFKNKDIILNVLIVTDTTNTNYSLDNDNVIVENISSTTVSNMIKDNKIKDYIISKQISLVILDEVKIKKYEKIKCVNKIIITNEKYVRLDYVKYKDYKLINSVV